MAMGVLLVAGAKARYIVTISALSLADGRRRLRRRLVNNYQLARVRVFFDEDNPGAASSDVYQVDNAVRGGRDGRACSARAGCRGR